MSATPALPTPREAMASAVQYARLGDLNAAHLWLDIARELREGAVRTAPDRVVSRDLTTEAISAGLQQAGEWADRVAFGDPRETVQMRIPEHTVEDATKVIRTAIQSTCGACGGETVILTGGKIIHRSTYEVECESVRAGA